MTHHNAPGASAHAVILEALQQGDKNRGELFDLTGKTYPILIRALQQLKDEKQIETYFVLTEGVPVLTYRLYSGG